MKRRTCGEGAVDSKQRPDTMQVLNLVPLEDGSIDPDELQHQLPARSRLLVEYYRYYFALPS